MTALAVVACLVILAAAWGYWREGRAYYAEAGHALEQAAWAKRAAGLDANAAGERWVD